MGLGWLARLSVLAGILTVLSHVLLAAGLVGPVPTSGSDVLQVASLASLLVFGLALPFVLFPLTSGCLALRDGDVLSAITVLGRRHLSLGPGSRAVCFEVTSWAHSWWVTAVRGKGARGRILFIDSELWGDSVQDFMNEEPRELKFSAIVGFVAVVAWACVGAIPVLLYVFLVIGPS